MFALILNFRRSIARDRESLTSRLETRLPDLVSFFVVVNLIHNDTRSFDQFQNLISFYLEICYHVMTNKPMEMRYLDFLFL